MDQYTAISKLRHLIAKSEQPWVITALRVDPLIWKFLCSSNLLELKKKDTGSLGNLRAPFNLACISMGLENSIDTRKSSFYSLDSELQNKALMLWEMHFCSGKNIESLRDAGLLSFLMLDKISRGQTWESIFEILSSQTENRVDGNWKTIFGILYSIVDPTDNFISAIMASFKKESALDAICHSILMQPQPISSHEEIFSHLFHGLILQEQITCLKLVRGYGYSKLVTIIGRKILESQPERIEDIKNEIHLDTFRKDPEKINIFNSIVEILDLIGESKLAGEILTKITLSLDEMVKNTNYKKQIIELENTDSIDHDHLPDRGISRILLLILEFSQKSISEDLKTTEITKLIEILCQTPKSDFEFVEPSITKTLIAKTLNAVERLGDNVIYYQLIESLISSFPNDDEILKSAIDYAIRVKDGKRAIEFSNMFLILHPEDTTLKIQLADLLESEGHMTQAYSERLDILENSIIPDKAIQIKTAKLALSLGDFGKAESICSDILNQDLDNEEILSIRGFSRVKIGLDLLAENDLKQVVLLNPQNEQAWIKLIELSEKLNDDLKKKKTINEAYHNLPNSAFINHQKAKISLRSNSWSDALPFLRVAYQTSNQNLELVLDYANTLEQLGLQDEEKELLEKLDRQLAEDPRIMRLIARLLMREGKYNHVIDKLIPSLDQSGVDESLYLEIAEAITGMEIETFSLNGQIDESLVKKIYNFLENVLKKNNDDFRINFFHILLQLVLKKNTEAYTQIQKLAQKPEAKNSRWIGPVQACLARAALENGEEETALILLREAYLLQPKNPAVQKLLAKAYLKNELKEEALETSRNILANDPQDPDRLEWYATFMREAGNQKEAIKGYEKLLDIGQLSQWIVFPFVETLIADSQFIRTREILSKLIDSTDVDGNYYKNAAKYAIKIQDSCLAIDLLEKSIAKNPNDLETIALKVKELQKMKRYSDAFVEITKAIELDGKNVLWYLVRSDISATTQQPFEAINDLLIAQKIIEQQNKNYCWSLAGLEPSIQDEGQLAVHIGCLLLEEKKFVEAYIQFRKGLQFAPDNIQYRYLCMRLADGLLLEDEFDQIGAPTEVFRVANDITKLSVDEKSALAGIYGYLAQHAIDNNENCQAEKLIKTGNELDAENSDVRIADALIKVRKFENQTTFQKLSDFKPFDNSLIAYPIVLLGLQHWKSSLDNARENANRNFSLPKVNIILAKVIVSLLEVNKFRQELGAKSIVKELGETEDQLTEEAFGTLTKASELTSSKELKRLENRLRLLRVTKADDVRNYENNLSTPEEMVALASVYRRLGMSGDLDNTVNQFPKFPLLMFEKAKFLVSIDPEASSQIAFEIVELEPENDLVWVLIANLFANNGKYHEAIQSIQKSIEINNDEIYWHLLCAEWAKHVEDTAQEISHLTKALETDATNFTTQKDLGDAFIRAGMPEKVILHWRNANSITTNKIEMSLQLAHAYHMLGNESECAMYLENAIDSGANSSEANFAVAEFLFKIGDPKKAYEFSKRAAVLNPKDSKSIILLSKILEIRNSAEDALKLINKSLSANIHTSEIILEKARLIRKVSGDKSALEAFEDALNLDPEDGIIHAELAECLYNLSKFEDAKIHAMESLQKNQNQPIMNALMGKIFQSQGHLDAAISYFICAIVLSPTTLDYYLTLCQIYQMKRDFQNALKTCRKAIEILPDEIQPYIIAGQILKDGKDYSSAETMIRKAQALDPENLAIRRQLGAIIALNMVMSSQEVSSAL